MATAGGQLTAVAVKAVGAGKRFVGGGLFLDVRANGSRYWPMKYGHADKAKLLAFGVYPEVTLAEAKRRRDAAREAIRNGRDPMADRDKAQAKLSGENTFQAIAEQWLDKQRGKLAAVTATKA